MPQADVTEILRKVAGGDDSAASELFGVLYEELRALAASFFRDQRPDHTLQPTALVHEAYAKMVGATDISFQGKAHFMAVAARAMRQNLIDHARRRGAEKRGGGAGRVTLDEAAVAAAAREVDLLELDDALARLEALNERQCRIVELRYFAGLSVEETAAVLDVSAPTVKRDWRMARAWLLGELLGDDLA
jgi:RNA polymerase sigma factor (TIGR02999 family)